LCAHTSTKPRHRRAKKVRKPYTAVFAHVEVVFLCLVRQPNLRAIES
jgi:hypothetical protein